MRKMSNGVKGLLCGFLLVAAGCAGAKYVEPTRNDAAELRTDNFQISIATVDGQSSKSAFNPFGGHSVKLEPGKHTIGMEFKRGEMANNGSSTSYSGRKKFSFNAEPSKRYKAKLNVVSKGSDRYWDFAVVDESNDQPVSVEWQK